MPVVSEYLPTAEELAEAITEKNRDFLEAYVAAVQVKRANLVQEQSQFLMAANEAKTRVDITKAAIRDLDSQLSSVKSIMFGWPKQ